MRHYVNLWEEDIGTVFVLEIGSIAEGGAGKGESRRGDVCGGRGGGRSEEFCNFLQRGTEKRPAGALFGRVFS